MAEDWGGDLFCAINLGWDYKQRTVDLIILGYVEKLIHKYQHTTPRILEHHPHQHNPPKYGKKIQYVESADDTPPFKKDEIKKLMEIIGSLLFLGRAINNAMLMALSDLVTSQAKCNKETQEAENDILNYCATHPNSTIIFQGRQMTLKVHSDA